MSTSYLHNGAYLKKCRIHGLKHIMHTVCLWHICLWPYIHTMNIYKYSAFHTEYYRHGFPLKFLEPFKNILVFIYFKIWPKANFTAVTYWYFRPRVSSLWPLEITINKQLIVPYFTINQAFFIGTKAYRFFNEGKQPLWLSDQGPSLNVLLNWKDNSAIYRV